MNPHTHVEEHLEMETQVQATKTETDILAQCVLPLRKSLPCSGCGSGTKRVAVIAYRSCAIWSSSNSLC